MPQMILEEEVTKTSVGLSENEWTPTAVPTSFFHSIKSIVSVGRRGSWVGSWVMGRIWVTSKTNERTKMQNLFYS